MPIVSRLGAASSRGFGQFGGVSQTGRALYWWGQNYYGEALNGNASYLNSPVLVPALSDYSFVYRGYANNILVKSDGTLWINGSNAYGQRGNSTTGGSMFSPVQIGSGTNWVTGASGLYYWLAIKSDGTLWGCGYNAYAMLGNNSTANFSSPVQIGSATNWSKVYTGYYDSYAITTSGNLYTCGYNYYGEGGTGTAGLGSSYLSTPTIVGGQTDWTEIFPGGYTVYGLRGTALYGWGYNAEGAVGDNTIASRSSPVQISGTWIAAACSNGTTGFGIKSDGSLWAWGSNYYGELGDPTLPTLSTGGNRSSPVQVGSDISWASLAGGYYQAFAAKSDGSVWTWGYNGLGGIGNKTFSNVSSPIQVGTFTSPTLIKGNAYGYYTLKTSTGSNYGWGNNGEGYATLNFPGSNSPVLSTAKKAYSTVQIGSGSFTGKTKDGKYYVAAQYNTFGTQGNSTSISVYSPTLISGTWSDLSISYYNSAGVKSDGTLWTWGFNNFGQLGLNTQSSTSVSSPVQVGSDTNWSKVVAASPYYMVALKTNGTLWTWGYNTTYGLLGLNDTISRSSPVQVGSATDWSSIGQFSYYTTYAFRGSTLYSWGYNEYGQLGTNDTIYKSSPVSIGSYADVRAGYNFMLLRKSDGTLWACGQGAYGAIGNNSILNVSSPVQIGSATDWSKITATNYAWNAIKTNGTLWGCGYNDYGQVGDGTFTSRSSPVQIGSDTNWTDFTDMGVYNPNVAGAFK